MLASTVILVLPLSPAAFRSFSPTDLVSLNRLGTDENCCGALIPVLLRDVVFRAASAASNEPINSLSPLPRRLATAPKMGKNVGGSVRAGSDAEVLIPAPLLLPPRWPETCSASVFVFLPADCGLSGC